MKIIEVTDREGRLIAPEWLAAAETLHRQLRPMLPEDYAGRMQKVFANGARLWLGVEDTPDGEKVRVLGLWRVLENTYEFRRLYVDDLVTDEAARSRGFGEAMLAALEGLARELACDTLALDSAVHRFSAHKFYFREDMHIFAYSFRKALQ